MKGGFEMIHDSHEAEKNAALHVAELMLAAARTAPKACGIDNIEAVIVDGEEKDRLAEQMRKYSAETGKDFHARDSRNVDGSPVVVVIGVKKAPTGLDFCGLCGLGNCSATVKAGASCALNLTDLGIAIGSAVSVAANHRFDNRVMFSVGKAAMALNYLPPSVKVAFGVPLSASGKSIFFDRGLGSAALQTADGE
jgi:uncharacterized ferredoxin-like protein